MADTLRFQNRALAVGGLAALVVVGVATIVPLTNGADPLTHSAVAAREGAQEPSAVVTGNALRAPVRKRPPRRTSSSPVGIRRLPPVLSTSANSPEREVAAPTSAQVALFDDPGVGRKAIRTADLIAGPLWEYDRVERAVQAGGNQGRKGADNGVVTASLNLVAGEDGLEVAPDDEPDSSVLIVNPAEAIPVPGPSRRVTLHLDDAEVRQVLEMFSRSYSLNILVAPEVSGLVTANFEDVPLDEALAGVLKLCGLVGRQEGKLLFVYPGNSYPRVELALRVFHLNYASAKELLTSVEGLLSDSGTASITEIDPANNRRTTEALVVTDTPPALSRIEQYILDMDRPPRQVMIEAHVLEITLEEEDRHGINYNHLFGADLELDMMGLANPAAPQALFARIHGSQVNALIECLQTTTDAKTLASPRVMVVNGQTARLQVGEQLGFKVITVTETAAIEEVKFLDVGVVLHVTPQIGSDDRVLMRVSPEVSSGQINPETLLPEETTRELETDVLVSDGQGVVIGGLIQEKCSNIQKKVTWLGDIWLVGKLFQRRERIKKRTEVVVALVPHIVDCDGYGCEADVMCVERCRTPIFEGPLRCVPRTEPCLPDALENPVWPRQWRRRSSRAMP